MARYKYRYQSWIRDYFTFTKWQRRALMVLVPAIVVVALLPWYWQLRQPPQAANQAELQAVTEWVNAREYKADMSDAYDDRSNQFRQPARNTETSVASYFYFDPNTASLADWQRLGVHPKAAASIQKYLHKGGRFRQPDDLLKIYSLPPDQARALIPWVRIAGNARTTPAAATAQPDSQWASRRSTDYKPRAIEPIDINTADTSAWIALPGIGSKLANRIVNFREKLGGFSSVAQVAETFGLPDSTFQKIKPHLLPGSGPYRLLPINSATADELKSHPYIRWKLANAIVQYRQQHGRYQSLADLRKIAIADEATLEKLAPYLSFQ
jgi:competence ComEA-like helix-hairpin-helix protein